MSQPDPPEFPRRHLGSDGFFYDVALAPIERQQGIDPSRVAVVFTRERDAAVLTTEVLAGADLRWMTASELDDLLARAV